MAVTFPSIAPTGRSFTAPRWPTSGITTQSGVTTRRLWGSRPSEPTLDLEFNNIDDASVSAILNAYNNAKGSVDSLALPTELFAGANATLTSWLDASATGAGLLWFFTEGSAPTVESVGPGRSSVRVSLTAELRAG